MDSRLEGAGPTNVSEVGGPAARISDAVPRRFTAGDALRGIAAMLVLVFHACTSTLYWKFGRNAISGEDPTPFHPLFGKFAPEFVNTRAGIYIFFVLSGYLLTRPFLAAYLLDTPRPSIPRYFRNRALRIIPAFWVVATVYLIWDRLHPGGGFLGTLAVYGFAQNYYSTASAEMVGQAWTLDIEVAFYILIPIAAMIALASRRRMRTTPAIRLAIVLVVLAVLYALSLYFKHEAGSPSNVSYNIAQYLFAFIPGIALGAIEPFAAPRLRGTQAGRIWAWGLLALCVILLSVYVSVPSTDDNTRLILVTIGCGALLAAPLALQWTTGGCWRVFDNRVIRWLGVRSYGIYLIHLGLMTHVLARLGHGHSLKTTFVLLLVGVLIATLLAAELLWRFVERPALELRLPWRQAEFVGAGAPAAAGTQPADA